MNEIVALDQSLFRHINHDWANSFFDTVMPAITDFHRHPAFLFAVIPLLLFWVWRRRSSAVRWIVVLAVSVGLSDGVSYRLIKHTVERQRPSEAGLQVDLRTHLHTGSSFPSNHAANMFAGATVMSFAFPPFSALFFLLAAAVGYSRIYVGVHFPLDVLAGAFLGIALALMTIKAASRWWRLMPPSTPVQK